LDRLRALRISVAGSFELIQSIAVGCPRLEYLRLGVREMNGVVNIGLSALGELARLRRLRSLFIRLELEPTESERASLLEAMDKIIEAKGNVLENLFIDWNRNQGSKVDQHFLYKILVYCKNICRIGYPCKFVFNNNVNDNVRDGGGVGGEAAAVEQFLAALDTKFVAAAESTNVMAGTGASNAEYEKTTTKCAQTNITAPKLTLALGDHESIRILHCRMQQQEATTQRIQWIKMGSWMDNWQKLSRNLWNAMVKQTLIKPPSSRFYI